MPSSNNIDVTTQWWWDYSESFSVTLTAESICSAFRWIRKPLHNTVWKNEVSVTSLFFSRVLISSSEQRAQLFLIRRLPSWCLSWGRIRQPVDLLKQMRAIQINWAMFWNWDGRKCFNLKKQHTLLLNKWKETGCGDVHY